MLLKHFLHLKYTQSPTITHIYTTLQALFQTKGPLLIGGTLQVFPTQQAIRDNNLTLTTPCSSIICRSLFKCTDSVLNKLSKIIHYQTNIT